MQSRLIVLHIHKMPLRHKFQKIKICLWCRYARCHRQKHYKQYKTDRKINAHSFFHLRFCTADVFNRKCHCHNAKHGTREIVIDKAQPCNHHPRCIGAKPAKACKQIRHFFVFYTFKNAVKGGNRCKNPYCRVAKCGDTACRCADFGYGVPYRFNAGRPGVLH